MSGLGVIGKQDALCMAVIVFMLGAMSVGADCGGATPVSIGSGQHSTSAGDDDAGDDNSSDGGGDDSSDSVTSTGADTVGPLDAAGASVDGGSKRASDAAAGDANVNPTSNEPQCTAMGGMCDGGTTCCGNNTCFGGMCGACAPEGMTCGETTLCCDSLSCISGACGTSLCVPDGTQCGGSSGVVCCNDDCISNVCGGLDAGR